MTSDRTSVIAGSTRTGAKIADILPEEGFAGRLVLIGAEHGIPLDGVVAVKRGAA
jgi:hypothetical protein